MKKTPFSDFLFGGDYNPEQWPHEIWLQDMQLLTDAAVNSATINVFSWAQLQPAETEYDFSTLDRIVKLLVDHHFKIVLATSTAALPAWMARRYPDVNRVDYEGRRHHHGQRHNACPNSPTFRKMSVALTSRLAERYGHFSEVVCWHVSNEYGGLCYCDNCARAFRVWLQQRYTNLEALNEAWYSHFWGHTYSSWDDIIPPNGLGDGINNDRNTVLSGSAIDYRRFMSDSILQNFIDEKQAIRQFDEETPVTTNLMGTFKDLDYFKWATHLDIVSWDNYPAFNTPASFTSLCHDLMRGLKHGQPFMLMEQTPSQQNWQPYNSLKRPGQMREMSYQAVAHGADTIQYFQLRQSRGGTEKFHGAVINADNSNQTRVYRETAALGHELARVGQQLQNGQSVAQVAIIFDWDNYWAVDYSSGPNVELEYVDQVHQFYAALYRQHVAVDFISSDTSLEELQRYQLVLAPVLMMVKPGLAEHITDYVQAGGHFVTSFLSGLSDEHDNLFIGGYPGPFRQLSGVWAEEIDALPPHTEIPLDFGKVDQAAISMVANVLHTEGADVLATYGGDDFYHGTPAITRHTVQAGTCDYVGGVLNETAFDALAKDWIANFNLTAYELPAAVELTTRHYTNYELHYLLNHTQSAASFTVPQKLQGTQDLLSEQVLTDSLTLDPYAVMILKTTK